MNVRDLSTNVLTRDEGFRKSAYTDHLGYWTIGIGRLIDARKGGGISRDEAEYLLANDIARVCDQLDGHLPWWKAMTTPRRVVLISMVFQLGLHGVLNFRNTLKAMKEGRYEDAAMGMLASRWASQTPLRVARLAAVMSTGEADDFQLDEDPS